MLNPDRFLFTKFADGLKPIRTVGVTMLGAKRAVFIPTAITCLSKFSGWTKAHPYGGGHDAGSEACSIYSHRTNSTIDDSITMGRHGMPCPYQMGL